MKNSLNLSQLMLLSRNGPDSELSLYYDFANLTEIFFSHIQEFFGFSNIKFEILEPLFSFEFDEPQQSTLISINGTELGELSLFHNSFYTFSSLVYYSSTGLLETIVLNESLFLQYSVNNYIALIHEFSSMLLGEKAFYDHLNSK